MHPSRPPSPSVDDDHVPHASGGAHCRSWRDVEAVLQNMHLQAVCATRGLTVDKHEGSTQHHRHQGTQQEPFNPRCNLPAQVAYAAPISGFVSGWPASIAGKCCGLPFASSAQGAKACLLAREGESHHRRGRLLLRNPPLFMQDSGGGGQREGDSGISLGGRAIALSKEDTAEGKKLQEILSRYVHASPCPRVSVSLSASLPDSFDVCGCRIVLFYAIKKPRNAKRHTE
jgi:hypothetical protein